MYCNISKLLTFFAKGGFKCMPISTVILYLQENRLNFIKVLLFFIKVAKIIEIGLIFPAEKSDSN